jgi:hypothetical protein
VCVAFLILSGRRTAAATSTIGGTTAGSGIGIGIVQLRSEKTNVAAAVDANEAAAAVDANEGAASDAEKQKESFEKKPAASEAEEEHIIEKKPAKVDEESSETSSEPGQ